MSLFKMDPGPCPTCGAAHTTCTATSGAPSVALLPMRDATQSGTVETMPLVGAVDVAPLAGEVEPPGLGDGSDARPFSTGTYRGKKPRK